MSRTLGDEDCLRQRIEQLEGLVARLEERRRVEREDEHDARMDAIGRFSDGVVSELDDIVQALSANADRAVDGTSVDEPGRRRPRGLRDATQRAEKLARRLRATGANRAPFIELVDPNEVVERFVSLVRGALPVAVELDFIPGHDVPSVAGDPALLEQMLLNLSLNARDAMLEGGRITIETESVVLEAPHDESPEREARRFVLLSVSDEGEGMDPAVKERAFEPFFTTKEAGCGAGLGLAMVRGVARIHGGLVRLESERGRGTTVEIYLPVLARAHTRPPHE